MPKESKLLRLYMTENAEKDLNYWSKSGNQKISARIEALLLSAQETPETGIGKPKRLKFEGGDTYSRRINHQHRLVYRVEGERLIVLSARLHYGDK